jgi:TRAP-type C4-dicarboxylate transport system permease small subunit
MLRHLAGAFDKATAFVACVLVAALLVCVSLGVITRAAGAPLIWTDEFSRFLMVWLAVFGGILASRKRLHVRIRYFQDLLPTRAHRAVELAIQLAVTLFGVLICAFSVGLVNKNLDLEATSLPISMSWMYVPMVLAGVVFAVQGAREIVEVLRRPKLRASSGAEPPVE